MRRIASMTRKTKNEDKKQGRISLCNKADNSRKKFDEFIEHLVTSMPLAVEITC